MLETKRRNEDHELGRFWLSVLQGLESGKPAGSTEGSNCCGTANGISDAPCTATENKHNRARKATAHPRSPVMLLRLVYTQACLDCCFSNINEKGWCRDDDYKLCGSIGQGNPLWNTKRQLPTGQGPADDYPYGGLHAQPLIF